MIHEVCNRGLKGLALVFAHGKCGTLRHPHRTLRLLLHRPIERLRRRRLNQRDTVRLATQGNNQRLMLPEQRPIETLERIIALDQAEDLLSRDITVVDFRLVDRPTLRLVDRAMEDFRNITFLKLGDQ